MRIGAASGLGGAADKRYLLKLMDKVSLHRRAAIHQAFADSLKNHLERLWQRTLSEHEGNTVLSATLCCSFMSLEALDNGLAVATSIERANEDYEFLASERNR